jgi:hypothetical protein
MRNSFQTNPVVFKIIVLITCFLLVMIYNKSKAADIYHYPPATFKKATVLFTENVAKKELKVLIKAGGNKVMQIYFYSTMRKLVKEVLVNNSQETIIKDMQKGIYFYDCFDNDLKLKSGKLIIQ